MKSSALLLLDFQRDIVERSASPRALAAAVDAASAARSQAVPVIFVRLAFRPGAPEVAPSNQRFSAARDRLAREDDAGSAVHDSFQQRADEPVVTKRQVSAFVGSDLAVLLSGLEVRRLVIGGISTSGVVLSTLCQAVDLDFEVVVLSDVCSDPDADVHRVLTQHVFPKQAAVLTVDEWKTALQPGAGLVRGATVRSLAS